MGFFEFCVYFKKMVFLGSLLGILGFGVGISIGVIVGYFLFIYYEPRDVKDYPENTPFDEIEPNTLIDLLPELPLWVMNPDYERVDWFNEFIANMWPFLDKAICGIIKSTCEPIFAEYIGKYQIKSILFEQLTLGTIPPRLHGIKVYDSNEKELVFEFAIRWAANPNIVVSLKLLSLQISVQLVDFQVAATARATLKPFVPTFPCFSSIIVSLTKKPEVDFGLKLIGGDLMAIPGLHHFVQETISKQVARLYLWPQTLEIPILDSSIGAVKKPVGILHVKVLRAQKLLNMDFLSKSDPYVKLSLGGDRLPAKKTTVKMNTLNPVWDEDFKLTVKDPEAQVLQLHLYDWEKIGAHDKLGMQVVPLKLLTPYEKKELTLDLLNSTNPNDRQNKKPRGQIMLEVSFIPFQEDSLNFNGPFSFHERKESVSSLSDDVSLRGAGLLLVNVIAAEDVEGKHHTNPYAVVVVRGEKRKTKARNKTWNPKWEEEFQFMLEEAPLKDLIHIEVKSKKRRFGFRSKELLGYVDIQLKDVIYNGRINEKYHLINSKDGILHVDIGWKVI
ncbi:synaptotagmin-3 isoform X1 [Capsicum galapagoense]